MRWKHKKGCVVLLGLLMMNLTLSCREKTEPVDSQADSVLDEDGDGHFTPEDCDDSDPEVHPGEPFRCIWAALPACALSMEQVFSGESMRPPDGGSNSYVVPSEEKQSALSLSIRSALNGQAEESLQAAVAADYQLCAEGNVLLWYPPSASGGAALALRTHPSALDLVLQTPHSFFDLGTLEEGVALFQSTGARALLSSGTHRCASDISSDCSGQTPVCTLLSSEPFRISDMAHTDSSFFHAAHLAVADGLPETTILQLHMFLEPGASVSNGKTRDTTSDQPSARLTDALQEALPDMLVTSCNDYGAGNYQERVCGTSNTQGRHLNGSADACGEGASEVSGRFIHLEQNVSVIERVEDVSDAILSAF